ncbi:MAG: SpaH/EbpB family LPXTG-anchored major pilin [Ruminococcus sp.]|nr:SpaH/EbpB family LPXTG-anchored major pilin [Ruminococcus sp.]
MKITKKITSLLLVMLLAVSAFVFAIPASAATYPTSNVTLKIHKYELSHTDANEGKIGNSGTDANPNFTAPSGATPLAGVEFYIYKVGDINTPQPTSYTTSEFSLLGKVTTDANGVADFTIGSPDFGLYYVEEGDAPAKVTQKSAPFFVYLPSTNAQGTDWLTEVNVYPKNLTTLASTSLTKTVNNATYNPSDVATAPTFALIDTSNGNAEVVTFTLASKNTAAPAPTVSTDAKYASVTARIDATDPGKMIVEGLPTGTYKWTEKTAVTLDGSDTALPKAADTATFTVTAKTSNNQNFAYTMDNSATPTVTKTADADTQTIGKDVVWTITPSIPSDIATYKKYEITDTIANELDFAGESAVQVIGLTSDQYTLTVNGKSIKIAVNEAGRKALAAVGASLTIKITTQINANAVVDKDIENSATLSFENQYGTTGEPSSSDTVKTGAALFKKVDASTNAGLAGAEFELQDANGNKINVSSTGDGEYVVNPSANSYVVTSGTNGKIYIKGLAYGSYKLVEVKAPAGYQLITAPFEFTVGANTATTEVTIKNVPQPQLPITGGMGTMLFTVAGLALIGGGAFFFFRSRKSKKEEN